MKIRQILKSKKGFTMTELIVVIVIIAILAAALIPSFLGFVRNAEEATLYNEARVAMVAFQTLITENGKGPTTANGATPAANNGTASVFFTNLADGNNRLSAADAEARFIDYVVNDIRGVAVAAGTIDAAFTDIAVTNNRVTGLTYTSVTPPGTVTIP